METDRGSGKVWVLLIIVAGCAVLLASVLLHVGSRYRNHPILISGAVVKQDEDPRKQSPIEGVEVTTGGVEADATVKTNLAGFFNLRLRPGAREGQLISLHFRHPQYEPFDINTAVGDNIFVIHMAPVPMSDLVPDDHPDIVVRNILVLYTTETTGQLNVGTGLKTFQVKNVGDIPCESRVPCSPDGKWRAAIESASLDAGQGNVFEDARVFCIAGPCPFTRIESDGYSKGGRNISVSVRDWSDTTTFILEAEVFRQQRGTTVRQSYPVIFGQTFDFSLPSSAQGPSLDAELNGESITFPLGPAPDLSWATCTANVGRDNSKIYRCELKQGFKFP